MFKIYDEALSPNVGGIFKIYDELFSPNGGTCLICDEPLSPNDGACLKYVMNRGTSKCGMFKMSMRPQSSLHPVAACFGAASCTS